MKCINAFDPVFKNTNDKPHTFAELRQYMINGYEIVLKWTDRNLHQFLIRTMSVTLYDYLMTLDARDIIMFLQLADEINAGSDTKTALFASAPSEMHELLKEQTGHLTKKPLKSSDSCVHFIIEEMII